MREFRVLAHRQAMLAGGKTPHGAGDRAMRQTDVRRRPLRLRDDGRSDGAGRPSTTPPHWPASVRHCANGVAARLPLALAQMQAWWPGVAIPSCPVLISPLSPSSDGTGGAYHYGCAATDLYCDCCTLDNGLTTLGLYLAELSEVYQATQARGWDCGASNGEALSRVQASYLRGHALDGYQTFPAWLDGDRPNWIDRSEPTDQDAVSTGCAAGFIWWLVSIGYSLPDIAAAGGTTLAETADRLGIGAMPWATFRDQCQQRWPLGQPSGVTVDNPWFTPTPPAATLIV